jgi:hypothetical protein
VAFAVVFVRVNDPVPAILRNYPAVTPRRTGSTEVEVPAIYSESVSVALLLAVLGSGTLFGEVTVAVSEIDPVAELLIVPVAL